MKKVKNSILHFFILSVISMSSCNSNSEKEMIAEDLVIDKCELIEGLMGMKKQSLETSCCICIQDRLIEDMEASYSVKELEKIRNSPEYLEIIIAQILSSQIAEVKECLSESESRKTDQLISDQRNN